MQNWNKTIQLQQLSFGKRKCYCIRSAVGLVPSTCTELAAVFLQVVGCMGRHLGKGTSENLKSWVTKYLQIWHNLMFCSLTEKKYDRNCTSLLFVLLGVIYFSEEWFTAQSEKRSQTNAWIWQISTPHCINTLFFSSFISGVFDHQHIWSDKPQLTVHSGAGVFLLCLLSLPKTLQCF